MLGDIITNNPKKIINDPKTKNILSLNVRKSRNGIIMMGNMEIFVASTIPQLITNSVIYSMVFFTEEFTSYM
ncbi:MAG: hypothetical protein IPG99_07385 [Ignavibacteria bacterium]|nr:hypothetical protein [Ignavibacteria bacterium]